MPVGPDPVGEVYAVAISPDSSIVAVGGWTERLGGGGPIYLFDRKTGASQRSHRAPRRLKSPIFSRSRSTAVTSRRRLAKAAGCGFTIATDNGSKRSATSTTARVMGPRSRQTAGWRRRRKVQTASFASTTQAFGSWASRSDRRAAFLPGVSPSVPTAACWRSAMRTSRPSTFWTEIPSPAFRPRGPSRRPPGRTDWNRSPGRRTDARCSRPEPPTRNPMSCWRGIRREPERSGGCRFAARSLRPD